MNATETIKVTGGDGWPQRLALAVSPRLQESEPTVVLLRNDSSVDVGTACKTKAAALSLATRLGNQCQCNSYVAIKSRSRVTLWIGSRTVLCSVDVQT